jgi:hypothetical protein
MIGQLLAMSEIPWFAAFSVVILQSAILISMAVRFRFRPDLRVILVASALAGCSYLVYQRIGPAIGVYGTECGEPPDHLCYGPVLAAGFPLQYFADVPTISVPGSLGHEDEFRGASLLLDILLYCAIIIVGQRFARILRIRLRDRRDREGSLEQHAGGG